MKKRIRKIKTNIVTGINEYTDYLMRTTPEQRKAARKKDRALSRAKFLRSMREFRPFNWKVLRKWQDKSTRFAQPANG